MGGVQPGLRPLYPLGVTRVRLRLRPGFLPLSLEPPFSDEALQQLQVDEIGPNAQDRANVGEVLLRSTVPVVLQLADDDVFGRRYPDRLAADGFSSPMGQAPAIERVVAREVDVGAESRLVVQQVEMAKARALDFGLERFDRRDIEFRGGKRFRKPGEIRAGEPKDQVQVEGQPGLAENDGGDGPGGHVGDLELVEGARETPEEVNQRHGRTARLPWRAGPRR